MTHDEMIAKAEQLEAYAAVCRREGIVQGPEGAEDAEQAAADWRYMAAHPEEIGDETWLKAWID